MTVFEWIISANDVILDEAGMKDVVTAVHWRYNATDGEFFVDTYGCAAVGTPTPEHFTDYDSLTKEQEVSWLEETLDVPSMQASLEAQLELLKNPVTATLPPPFSNDPVPPVVLAEAV